MLIIKLACRNILRNRRRSLLTLLSMSGGFFLLCLTLSMSEGSYSNIIDIFTKDHTGHVQVHQLDYLERPSLYKMINKPQQLISLLENEPNVVSVAPRVFAPSLAYGKKKTSPAQVVGIDPLRESTTTRLKSKVTQGEYFTSDNTPSGYYKAMIGFSLAKNLALSVGDELVLISQGIDGSIANDIFIITAIVGDANAYERMNVYLPLPAMQTFLSIATGENGQIHEIVIVLKEQKLARPFATQIQSTLADTQLSVEPWQVVESSFYHSMQADKKGSYISMAIIIFIVSIGVLNTVLMGTLERTREFGVLKAIGTRPISVFLLIIIESFILALVSCLFGLLLALPVCYWLASSGIPMPEPIDMGGVAFDTMLGEVSWFVVLLPSFVVMLSTVGVSLIPAVRAAKISPLKALQAA